MKKPTVETDSLNNMIYRTVCEFGGLDVLVTRGYPARGRTTNDAGILIW